MVTGFSQQVTTGLTRFSRMGARNTVPSSAARMVALGDFHSWVRPYSSWRCRLGVMVAHFTPIFRRLMASAACAVTASAVSSRWGRDRS